MINIIIKKVNFLYLKYYLINRKQSLAYQVMLILMNEHYLARNMMNNVGNSIGDDILLVDIKKEFSILKKLIFGRVSKNYKIHLEENFRKNSDELFENFIIGLIDKIGNNYCELNRVIFIDDDTKVKIPKLEFKMNQDGYRYQFNGYVRIEQKLQEKANLIALILGYFGSLNWLIENKYLNLNTDIVYLILVTIIVTLFYIFWHKSWKFLFLFIILLLFIA